MSAETKNLIIAPIKKYGDPHRETLYQTTISHVCVLDKRHVGYPQSSNSIVYSFAISSMPYCCGTKEIGNFSYNSAISNENLQKEIVEILSLELPIRLKAIIKERRPNGIIYDESLCFICMLIPLIRCSIMREVFLNTKLFRQINSFINVNTNNNVEMWISENGSTFAQQKLDL